jgi:hypothetical protein
VAPPQQELTCRAARSRFQFVVCAHVCGIGVNVAASVATLVKCVCVCVCVCRYQTMSDQVDENRDPSRHLVECLCLRLYLLCSTRVCSDSDSARVRGRAAAVLSHFFFRPDWSRSCDGDGRRLPPHISQALCVGCVSVRLPSQEILDLSEECSFIRYDPRAYETC